MHILLAIYTYIYTYIHTYIYIYEIFPLSYKKDSMLYILFCTFFHLKYVLEVTLHKFKRLFLILSTLVYGCAILYSTSFSWMNSKLFLMFSYHNNATVIKNLFPCCFVLIQVQRKFLELELPGQRVSADGGFCCSSQVPLLGVGLCPLGHHLSLESMWDLSPQRCCRMPVTSGPHSPACPSPAAAMPSFQVTDSCPPPAPVSPSSSWGRRRSSRDPEGRPVSMWKHRGWNRMFCLKNSLKFAAVNVTGVCNVVIHKDPLWTNCEGHRMAFAQSKLKWVSALWDSVHSHAV